jgi:PAS domain S-box-containing protein
VNPTRTIPLRRWLPVLVTGMFVLLLVGSTAWRYWQETAAAEADAREDLSFLLLEEQHRIEKLLRTRERSWVAEEIAQIGSRPQVAALALVDAAGEVLFSAQPLAVGRAMKDALPDFDAARLQQARANGRAQIDFDATRNHLLAYQPVALAAASGQIRSGTQGGLLLKYDLSADKARAMHRGVIASLTEIAFALMLMAAVTLLLRRWLARPLDQLLAAVGRIGHGDFATAIDVSGRGELVDLADAINRMQVDLSKSTSQLRLNEANLAITLQSIGDAVIATDPQGRITRMNPTAERLTGWPVGDALGQPLDAVFRIVSAQTRLPSLNPVQLVMQSGEVVALANHTTLLSRGGPEYHIADSAAPIRDRDGRTVGVVLVFSDVTERYRVEQALQASTDVLRLRDRALAEISQGVMMTDTQGRITYVNPGFEQLTGYSKAESLGRTARFLQGRATSPQTAAEISRAVREGRSFHGEILNYRKDGVELWLALDISPLHDDQGVLTGFVGAQRDVSERKQAEAARRELESQLRESQKMESIGTLAGGIAHDFNNILGAILGNLALARDDVGPGHAALRSLDQIGKASLRARDLVQQILAFSRRQPQELVVQPLNPILQETVALLRTTLPAMIDLRLELPAAPIHVNTDATQMQQVLMNLCTNAWHALSGSTGRIEVGLDEQQLDAAAGRALGDLPAGPYAHLWVCDTGIGMDAPTRERMFEPFFTTKAVGDGTGLGLSVVHGIVAAQQGGIAVTSEVGSGTTVELYLPVREPPVADRTDTSPSAEPVRGNDERVLYVDDDEVVRLVVERLLQRHGLQVVCVATAAEALSALAAAPSGFDLVVTDFNMPGSSGLVLAAEVTRLRPQLPVVIASGYLSDELIRGAAELGVRHLMQKQSLFDELVPLVLRILGARSAGLPD